MNSIKKQKAVLFFYAKKISLCRYFFLPVKKEQFFFDSFNGRSYTCSPKYLYLYLTEHGIAKPENCIWTCRDKDSFRKQIGDERVKLVEYGSKEYIKACMTSRILIINVFLLSIIPIRKNQCLINTWHGQAYKTIGMADLSDQYVAKKQAFTAKAKQTKYFLSTCSQFSEILFDSLYISHKKIIPSGLPRNDFLYSTTKMKNLSIIIENLCAKIQKLRGKNLADKIVVLYAPTCRTSNGQVIDLEKNILPVNKIRLNSTNKLKYML